MDALADAEAWIPQVAFALPRVYRCKAFLCQIVPRCGRVNRHCPVQKKFKGLWAISDPTAKPDIVIYYAHGGGFSMGSPYFYLEFLLSWISALELAGYANPAVFALDYTLVPDACFPTQLSEMLAGYKHVLDMASSPSRVCVAGDSAGGTLVLSLLLHLAHPKPVENGRPMPGVSRKLEKPAMGVLISPWPTLHSPSYQDNRCDFLNAETLHLYASQYAATEDMIADPLASPGNCRDLKHWRAACPSASLCVTYGKEEVLAPEIEKLVEVLRRAEGTVSVHGEEGGVHAWPVVSLFLAGATEQRMKGMVGIVRDVKSCIPPGK